MRFDDWDYEETLTYEELSARVDSEWEALGEEGQHQWYLSPSPTFEEYVLGQMKPGDSVIIDFNNYTHKIIKQ